MSRIEKLNVRYEKLRKLFPAKIAYKLTVLMTL